MRLAIFELLGYVFDKITDLNCLDIFLSFDGDDIVIEFSDIKYITKLILPLCDKSYTDFLEKSDWYTARLIFSKDAISSVVLENHLGECFTTNAENIIKNHIAGTKLSELYCQYCSEIIEYSTLLLTT